MKNAEGFFNFTLKMYYFKTALLSHSSAHSFLWNNPFSSLFSMHIVHVRYLISHTWLITSNTLDSSLNKHCSYSRLQIIIEARESKDEAKPSNIVCGPALAAHNLNLSLNAAFGTDSRGY